MKILFTGGGTGGHFYPIIAIAEEMREAIKELNKLVSAKQSKEALAKLPAAYQAIDKAKKRGVIKANTAARKKSHLALLVNKVA